MIENGIANLIIGNALAFVASVLMVVVGIIKDKKKIIFWQTIEIIFAGVSYIVLGSYTAAINMGISSARNILYYKEKLSTSAKIVLAILYTVLSLVFNNVGLIGIVLLGGSIASLFIVEIKNVVIFKLFAMLGMFVWAVHDISVQSYVAFIFDIGTIIALFISMFQIRKEKRIMNN